MIGQACGNYVIERETDAVNLFGSETRKPTGIQTCAHQPGETDAGGAVQGSKRGPLQKEEGAVAGQENRKGRLFLLKIENCREPDQRACASVTLRGLAVSHA